MECLLVHLSGITLITSKKTNVVIVVLIPDMPVVRGPIGDQHVLQEASGQVQDGIPGSDHLQKDPLRDV